MRQKIDENIAKKNLQKEKKEMKKLTITFWM